MLIRWCYRLVEIRHTPEGRSRCSFQDCVCRAPPRTAAYLFFNASTRGVRYPCVSATMVTLAVSFLVDCLTMFVFFLFHIFTSILIHRSIVVFAYLRAALHFLSTLESKMVVQLQVYSRSPHVLTTGTACNAYMVFQQYDSAASQDTCLRMTMAAELRSTWRMGS